MVPMYLVTFLVDVHTLRARHILDFVNIYALVHFLLSVDYSERRLVAIASLATLYFEHDLKYADR